MQHHILLLKEKVSKNIAWMELAGDTVEELDEAVGAWVIGSLALFRRKLNGRIPEIELIPVIMSPHEYELLEDQTWGSAMKELVKDVESGTRK